MWEIDDLEVETVEMDGSSAGIGQWPATRLRSDGECLICASPWSDWSQEPVQVRVCAVCGSPGCRRGERVSIRRAGDYVVWMPAFSTLLEGRLHREEYAPPAFIERRGIALFGPAARSTVRETFEEMPTRGAMTPLRTWEVLRIAQREAPGELLGRFPDDVQLRRDELLASDPVNIERASKALETSIAQWGDSEMPVEIRRMGAEDVGVTFFVELPSAREWSPIVDREPIGWRLGERFVVEPSGNGN